MAAAVLLLRGGPLELCQGVDGSLRVRVIRPKHLHPHDTSTTPAVRHLSFRKSLCVSGCLTARYPSAASRSKGSPEPKAPRLHRTTPRDEIAVSVFGCSLPARTREGQLELA